jgi:membrane protein DedA with SNARE-associated domain
MITETITRIATNVLDTTGYPGAAGLMVLESMIAPVPSEAVMPFVGFKVAAGQWNLWLAILSTSLGSVVGSLLSYGMGRYGGKPLVLLVGRFLLLNERDLEKTEKFFHRKAGLVTIFIARFVPVVRHFISIPAGIGRTPLVPFIAVTLVGATLWNTFLLWCGMVLHEKWPLVQKYSHQLDIGIVIVILIAMGWWVKVRLPRFRAGKGGPA